MPLLLQGQDVGCCKAQGRRTRIQTVCVLSIAGQSDRRLLRWQGRALSACQPCLGCCKGNGPQVHQGGFSQIVFSPCVILCPSCCRARSCGQLRRQETRMQQPSCAHSLRCSQARQTGSRLPPWQLWRSPVGADWKQVGSAATAAVCAGAHELLAQPPVWPRSCVARSLDP